MNYEILEALGQIAQEKNVSRDLVIETLEIGLVSAARKRYGADENVEVEVDRGSGTISVYLNRQVVDEDEVEEPGHQIALSAAREIDPETEIGSELRQKLDFADFGRNAIQTAKQILIQRVREAERERIFEDYQGRVGEIVSGTVQQISHGDVLVNLGRTEAVVPLKEQIRKERYRQGDPIRACLVNVLRTSKGPQLVLSRTHPSLLVKLFQLEVPEIYEGVIEIKAVAREPGERAKIAVHSNDPRIDPVGACVGMKGSRVQAVVRELSNERIDIIPWSEDEAIFLSRALSPAVVKRVVVDRREKQMTAIVDDDQLSLAIGKSGQNARLASQLSGWKVDIMNDSGYQEVQDERVATLVPLSQIEGVGKVMRERLEASGIVSANDVVASSLERLTDVPGIGEATAEKIKEAATGIVSVVVEAYRKEKAERDAKEAEEQAAREAEARRLAEEQAAKEAAEAEAAAPADAAAAQEMAPESEEANLVSPVDAPAADADGAGPDAEAAAAQETAPESEEADPAAPVDAPAADTDGAGPDAEAASAESGDGGDTVPADGTEQAEAALAAEASGAPAEAGPAAQDSGLEPPAQEPAPEPAPGSNGPVEAAPSEDGGGPVPQEGSGDAGDRGQAVQETDDSKKDVTESEGGELALGEDAKQ